jgi:hypothetical protein
MQPSEQKTDKAVIQPPLVDVHRRFLELQSEFLSLLTMNGSRDAGECEALVAVLRQHFHAAKVHLLCTNVVGALLEIQHISTSLDKLKSLLPVPASKESQ